MGSIRTSPFIPRTSFFVRVFQTLEVTIFGSIRTSPFIPRTPFSCENFKQFHVSILSHSCTKSFLLSIHFSKAQDMVDVVSKSPILKASAKRTPDRFIALDFHY